MNPIPNHVYFAFNWLKNYMYGNVQRKKFKMATLLISYFLLISNDLWMGKRQYNDFGSTINHISVTYITTSNITTSSCDNVYSKL